MPTCNSMHRSLHVVLCIIQQFDPGCFLYTHMQSACSCSFIGVMSKGLAFKECFHFAWYDVFSAEAVGVVYVLAVYHGVHAPPHNKRF